MTEPIRNKLNPLLAPGTSPERPFRDETRRFEDTLREQIAIERPIHTRTDRSDRRSGRPPSVSDNGSPLDERLRTATSKTNASDSSNSQSNENPHESKTAIHATENQQAEEERTNVSDQANATTTDETIATAAEVSTTEEQKQPTAEEIAAEVIAISFTGAPSTTEPNTTTDADGTAAEIIEAEPSAALETTKTSNNTSVQSAATEAVSQIAQDKAPPFDKQQQDSSSVTTAIAADEETKSTTLSEDTSELPAAEQVDSLVETAAASAGVATSPGNTVQPGDSSSGPGPEGGVGGPTSTSTATTAGAAEGSSDGNADSRHSPRRETSTREASPIESGFVIETTDATQEATEEIADAAHSKSNSDAPRKVENTSLSPLSPTDAKSGSSSTSPSLGRAEQDAAHRAEAGPRVDAGRFVNRVTKAFDAAQQRGGTVQLRLSPPELGAMRIELIVEQGTLSAKLEAETVAAKNLLLDNLPALRERLATQDIRVDKFEVDVRDQGSGQGRDWQPEQRHTGGRQQRQASSSTTTTPRTTATGEATRSVPLVTPDGRLNIVA